MGEVVERARAVASTRPRQIRAGFYGSLQALQGRFAIGYYHARFPRSGKPQNDDDQAQTED